VYTLDPSLRRSAAGSVMPSSAHQRHRSNAQHLGDDIIDQPINQL
jgi:hypothetical protein